MQTVRELRKLVNHLVAAWPEDHNHPTVEQAREYLRKHPTLFLDMENTRDDCLICGEDDNQSGWYSI